MMRKFGEFGRRESASSGRGFELNEVSCLGTDIDVVLLRQIYRESNESYRTRRVRLFPSIDLQGSPCSMSPS